MFSFAKTAAISAIFISASVGVALAGSHGGDDHHHDGQRDGRHEHDSFMRGDDDITTDDTPAPVFVVPAYTPAHVSGSRLETILTELRTDDQRMNADRARGLLTAGEYRRLRAEDAQIRHEAMAVADRNHGAIPTPRYAALQNEAQHLQTQIRRMA